MKSAIKSLLKRILFKDENPKTFPPVRTIDDQIVERVLLKTNSSSLDISRKHCVVCHAPFFVLVWLTQDQWKNLQSAGYEITITTKNRLEARAILTFSQEIEIENNLAVIFNVTDATCFQYDFFRRYFIGRYFRNKNTPKEDRIYGATYSYPRRVIAVSHKDNTGYNIFPMDFQCYIAEQKIYILGLRTTNITVQKILTSRKIVIGDTSSATLKTIYELGSHHSVAPPALDQLPFKVFDSDLFKFPVPDFSASYREVELLTNRELGSHMLLIGKVINEREVKTATSFLYHIHFFQSIYNTYKSAY